MPNEQSEKKPEEQTQEPQFVSREEFVRVSQQADAIASMLRKEREAASVKTNAIEAKLTELMERLEKPKDAPKEDKTAAELKALRAQLDAERTERERERSARMTQEERTALSQVLTAKGVTGPHLKGALALLYDAEKRIVRDDGGNVAFKAQRNGFDEVMPLEKALDEWLATEDGKAYLPPRQVQGSGTAPGKAPGNNPDTGMSKADAVRALAEWGLGSV